MTNRYRARNRPTKKDKTAMKERAREARAMTDLKIRLDIANSLSVLANAASIEVSVSCLLVQYEVATCTNIPM